MKDVTINISSVGFPSQFVSDAEKETPEFGLQIGQAIQYEWFRKDSTGCRYYSQWRDFNRLRLYARGEQSVAKYKNIILLLDGDRKGRYLTKRIIKLLEHRTKIDLSFKKKLISITKGKIRFIEQLVCYEPYVV